MADEFGRPTTRRLPSECVVYGAGSFGRKLAQDLGAAGVRVSALLDRNGSSQAAGLPVVHPEAADEFRGVPLVVGVCNPDADPAAITRAAGELGWTEIWSPVEVSVALGQVGVRRDHYWLTSQVDLYQRARAKLGRARALLADDPSREVFDRLLRYRVTGDLGALPEPEPGQYNPSSLDFISSTVHLVDGGAYRGDTVIALAEAGVNLASVLAFEPDPENFAHLSRELAARPHLSSLAFPLALGERTEAVRFDADGTSASAVVDAGGTWVQCVALDDVARNSLPTHLKLDVEGAEPGALTGMRRLLADARPRLAIAAYHRPEHLWSLILQLDGYGLGYVFHLRCHAYQCWETILYASPDV